MNFDTPFGAFWMLFGDDQQYINLAEAKRAAVTRPGFNFTLWT